MQINATHPQTVHEARHTSPPARIEDKVELAPGIATVNPLPAQSILRANARIDAIDAGPSSPATTAERARLIEQRDEAITRLTGNPDPSAYDPAVAGVAQRDGVTYNRAVANINKSATLGGRPATAEPVREMPWEAGPSNGFLNRDEGTNARVDRLMAEDGLSFDAAVAIAMTQRPEAPDFLGLGHLDFSSEPPAWAEPLADMTARSGAEIKRWAADQAENVIRFTEGNDTINVTMRDGMVVVSDGTTETVIDPSTTDRIAIAGGGGDDRIIVDPSVTADLHIAGGNGNDYIVGGGGNDIIQGGFGSDTIRSGDGGDIVIGGLGNDNIETGDGQDLAFGDAGNDYLSGGDGNDTLEGGGGRDSIYGGRDHDVISGDTGNDYLDGGDSSDLIRGGAGDDVQSGGSGNDRLVGNGGNDTFIGAAGFDRYDDASAGDTAIVEAGERVDATGVTVEEVNVDPTAGNSIEIDRFVGRYADGTPDSAKIGARGEFRQRVQDDLATLRYTSAGQRMLSELDRTFAETGNRVTISELDPEVTSSLLGFPSAENGFASSEPGSDWRRTAAEGNAAGSNSTVRYNPTTNLTFDTNETGADAGNSPPIVILFHELAHAYNQTSGTGLDGVYTGTDAPDNALRRGSDGVLRNLQNVERQAVGLPVDHDGDPRTPERIVPWHGDDGRGFNPDPGQLTENGLRRELNIAERTSYR